MRRMRPRRSAHCCDMMVLCAPESTNAFTSTAFTCPPVFESHSQLQEAFCDVTLHSNTKDFVKSKMMVLCAPESTNAFTSTEFTCPPVGSVSLYSGQFVNSGHIYYTNLYHIYHINGHVSERIEI